MEESLRRGELADFLRTRRDRLTPQQMGLPAGRRRRTAGLRREEVAQLAGVGLTWYTRLEQGRAIHVSSQVLGAIAIALGLDPTERDYLFRLAGRLPPPPEQTLLVPTDLLQLDTLPNWALYVRGRAWELLAWNAVAEATWGTNSNLFAGRRNMLIWFFTDPQARQFQPEWERIAPHVVAEFRASYRRHVGEPDYEALVETLRRVSPEFAGWWAKHAVRAEAPRPKVVNHPLVGPLQLQHMTFRLDSDPDIALIVELPIPATGSVEKLQQLMSCLSPAPPEAERDPR